MYPINVVEKETGISKYLLRMWERRYTFPRPLRDDKGERVYTANDIEKLQVVRALMNQGYRPSKIMDQDLPGLRSLLQSLNSKELTRGNEELVDASIIVVITNPNLESESLSLLKYNNVKKILRISTNEDLQKLVN